MPAIYPVDLYDILSPKAKADLIASKKRKEIMLRNDIELENVKKLNFNTLKIF
jgi:hypothetical protein